MRTSPLNKLEMHPLPTKPDESRSSRPVRQKSVVVFPLGKGCKGGIKTVTRRQAKLVLARAPEREVSTCLFLYMTCLKG